jgi:hypothetical protein
MEAAAQMKGQMQVQKRGGRARADRGALFHQGLFPSRIWEVARGAADHEGFVLPEKFKENP